MDTIIQNKNVKILSVDDIYPDVGAIKSGEYPISGCFYAVTYKGNENKNVDKFIDWILSNEGQEIVEKTGYIPIN